MGLALFDGTACSANAEPLNIVFAHHSSASNTFWQAVKKGFDDACEKIGANCQMVFTQTEGAVEQQLSNIEAVLVREPDALLTTIVDDKALDDVIPRASTAGTFVIGVKVVDSEGAKGNRRAAFVGQGLRLAGYSVR